MVNAPALCQPAANPDGVAEVGMIKRVVAAGMGVSTDSASFAERDQRDGGAESSSFELCADDKDERIWRGGLAAYRRDAAKPATDNVYCCGGIRSWRRTLQNSGGCVRGVQGGLRLSGHPSIFDMSCFPTPVEDGN